MVGFHVIDDDIVNLAVGYYLSDVLKILFKEILSHTVNHCHLFVIDEIGIVAHTFGQRPHGFEKMCGTVVYAYIIDIVVEFLHDLYTLVFEFVVVSSVAESFNYLGKESIFEFVHTCCESFGSIIAFHIAFCLKKRNALVKIIVAYVYCDSCFAFAAFQYVFVHMKSVHSFAAMLGQERGMDVDNAVGECFEQIIGNEQKKSRKHNGICVVALEQIEYIVLFSETAFGNILRGHAVSLGACAYSGFFSIVNHNAYIYIVAG